MRISFPKPTHKPATLYTNKARKKRQNASLHDARFRDSILVRRKHFDLALQVALVANIQALGVAVGEARARLLVVRAHEEEEELDALGHQQQNVVVLRRWKREREVQRDRERKRDR